MKQEPSVNELRAWAAKVCGYEPDGLGGFVRDTSDGYCFVLCDDWIPDEDIAQAFEVWEAVKAKHPKLLMQIYSPGCWRYEARENNQCLVCISDGPWGSGGNVNTEGYHDSLATALTQCCRQAWEAADA